MSVPAPRGELSGASHPGAGSSATVAVVTDSAASLPDVGGHPVDVVPMTVAIGDDVFEDGTIDPAAVLERSRHDPVATSAPSPGAYLATLERLGGRPVLVATVSRTMSASYDAAVTAAGYRPPATTVVVDTETAAGAQGLVVLAAARVAAEGRPLATVVGTARDVVRRVHLLACIEDLDRLAKSGRVPAVAAWAGRSLGVRLLFEFAGGAARGRRPARSTRVARQRMVTACRAGAASGGTLRAAVLHAQAPGPAKELAETLQAYAPGSDVYTASFSSVMVAHTGGGLWGVAWWWEPPHRTAEQP